MTGHTSSVIPKFCSFCHALRDDGVGYGDYPEQLACLLFLKRADEFARPPCNRPLLTPKEYNRESLTGVQHRSELEAHYGSPAGAGEGKGHPRPDRFAGYAKGHLNVYGNSFSDQRRYESPREVNISCLQTNWEA